MGAGAAGGRRCEELVEMLHLDAKPLATALPASRAAFAKGISTLMHITRFKLQQ